MRMPYVVLVSVIVAVTNIIPVFGRLSRRGADGADHSARLADEVPDLRHLHHLDPSQI